MNSKNLIVIGIIIPIFENKTKNMVGKMKVNVQEKLYSNKIKSDLTYMYTVELN